MGGSAMLDSGNTAWMLTATLLVLMMLLPGLALFYGGLVRAKNALSVMSQVLAITGLTILLWVGWGYSLAFSGGGPVVGDLAKAGLRGIDGGTLWPVGSEGHAIPELLFAAFQMTFAAITAALIVGATAERLRFGAMLLFSALFLTLVYAPLAHMVWAADGLIFKLGAIDFAGGTVVHINAGIAGLVAVAFCGPRIGYQKEAMPPHSLALVLVGAGLLWVGWFGFNAGSALEANGLAAVAMLNTMVAPAAGVLAWMALEAWRSGKPSLLGGASGAVAGLVAVTPAAGISGPLGAILLGASASLACTPSSPGPSNGSNSTTASTCSGSTASAGSSDRSARPLPPCQYWADTPPPIMRWASSWRCRPGRWALPSCGQASARPSPS